jgi:Trk-type K+ transport system membrane component
MGLSNFATVLILTVLFTILSSLGFGMFYLLLDQYGSKRTFMALSVRVALSMSLFLGLLIAIHFGWIIPNPPPL